MSTDKSWLDFLQSQGATCANQRVVAYPQNATNSTALYAITDVTTIDIAGPDAKKFLQGQVTCDINSLNPGKTSYGAQCTPKGRAIFSFLASSPNPERVRLRLPLEMIETVKTSLGKYMIFSKAEFEEVPQIVIGLEGTEAAARVNDLFGECPNAVLDAVTSGKGTAIKIDEQRFECWLDPSQAQTCWQTLANTCTVQPTELWHVANLKRGVARILSGTCEEFVPQTINYGQIGAISFTKGCYTGQEVVARMQYLGKQKRHTYLGKLPGVNKLLPGQSLYVPGKEQSVGKVVEAASTSDQTYLLACINEAAYEQGGVSTAPEAGQAITFSDLPYALSDTQ